MPSLRTNRSSRLVAAIDAFKIYTIYVRGHVTSLVCIF